MRQRYAEDHTGKTRERLGSAIGEDLICIKGDDIDRIHDNGIGAATVEAGDNTGLVGNFPFDLTKTILYEEKCFEDILLTDGFCILQIRIHDIILRGRLPEIEHFPIVAFASGAIDAFIAGEEQIEIRGLEMVGQFFTELRPLVIVVADLRKNIDAAFVFDLTVGEKDRILCMDRPGNGQDNERHQE